MTEREGLADLYYNKIKTGSNVGPILAQFFSELTGLPIGKSEIIMCNKLVKIFGRYYPFFAIIDVSRKSDLKDFPYGLIFTICRTRLESTADVEMSLPSFVNLDRMITEANKRKDSVKKLNADSLIERFLGED